MLSSVSVCKEAGITMPLYLVNGVSPSIDLPKISPTILNSMSHLMLDVYCEVHLFKTTADLSQALVIQILSHTLGALSTSTSIRGPHSQPRYPSQSPQAYGT